MDNTKLSKFLSYVLRHNPAEIGIKINREVQTDLNILVEQICKHKFLVTKEDIESVVRTNSKKDLL